MHDANDEVRVIQNHDRMYLLMAHWCDTSKNQANFRQFRLILDRNGIFRDIYAYFAFNPCLMSHKLLLIFKMIEKLPEGKHIYRQS